MHIGKVDTGHSGHDPVTQIDRVAFRQCAYLQRKTGRSAGDAQHQAGGAEQPVDRAVTEVCRLRPDGWEQAQTLAPPAGVHIKLPADERVAMVPPAQPGEQRQEPCNGIDRRASQRVHKQP